MYRNQLTVFKKIIQKNNDCSKLAVRCRTNLPTRKVFSHYCPVVSDHSTHQLLGTRVFNFPLDNCEENYTLLSKIDIFKGNSYVTHLSLFPENSLFDWYKHQPVVEVIGDNDRELFELTIRSVFLNFGGKRTGLSHQLLKYISTNMDERLEFDEMEDRIQKTLRLGFHSNWKL